MAGGIYCAHQGGGIGDVAEKALRLLSFGPQKIFRFLGNSTGNAYKTKDCLDEAGRKYIYQYSRCNGSPY
jgi:hypothetical protein